MLASLLRHLLITKPLRTGPNTPEYSLCLRAVRLLLPPLNPTKAPKWSVAFNPADFSFPKTKFSVTDLLLGSSERPLPLFLLWDCHSQLQTGGGDNIPAAWYKNDADWTQRWKESRLSKSDASSYYWYQHRNQTSTTTTSGAERTYTALFNLCSFFLDDSSNFGPVVFSWK